MPFLIGCAVLPACGEAQRIRRLQIVAAAAVVVVDLTTLKQHLPS